MAWRTDLTMSDHEPLTSIIIPMSYAGKVLERCLNSIRFVTKFL